ncbi:Putative selenocysteine protein (fragment) [Desulfamplus magnetovallimortis]|uniref:Putative selenocysteine protein n=1 Tax=Desulfamplus magnetovallimortis TaxID=1246637 RepID=A0A1W1HFA5_9BACT
MKKKTEPQFHNDIKSHKGKINILLIAPHGHPNNDENTGALTRYIAEQIDVYYIINEVFKKPHKGKGEIVDKEEKIINLNNRQQVEKHLKEDFLAPLLLCKKEIVEKYGSAILLWIHGIKDKNLEGDVAKDGDINPEDTHILVGYGQHKTEKRYTAQSKIVDRLIQSLSDNGITAVLANINKEKNQKQYCAWDKNNMNQLFRDGDYKDPNVQSIQLEFRWTGCRKTDEDILITSKKVANAISFLIQPEIETSDENKSIHHETSVLENRDDVIEMEDHIIQKAYDKLAQIFSRNYEQALMEAGQYLVRTFYGGEQNIEENPYDEDFVFSQETIENARLKKSPQKETLNQLYHKIDENRASNMPSKAWIYNAVNLIVQWYDIKTELKDSFHTYRNLSVSHKIYLLGVKNIEDKQILIEKIYKDDLSVRQLKEAKQTTTEKTPTLLSLINKPSELAKKENKEIINLKFLTKKGVKQLEHYQDIIEQKNADFSRKIEQLEEELKAYKQHVKEISKIKDKVEKALLEKTGN